MQLASVVEVENGAGGGGGYGDRPKTTPGSTGRRYIQKHAVRRMG